MKHLLTLTTMVLATLAWGCQNLHHDGDDDGDEHEIALNQVPHNVLAAAVAKVPGFVLEEACTEDEDGVLIYCLEGKANGKEYEIDVTAAGKVMEVESGEDEDEDEEDDD
ncbi:MAG: PepSY domain-containing protein [Planctomycetota bacterium]|nr:PepSY domain-containing protein [Planctomycetota bacterium]